ncbi:hypothetical protein [Deinococcus hohokamensis]|uniref:Uncharacterized protein n=1 Tax=Deinococcus hohokamensis TaxID=309883 RepID=A0ABV9I7T6_9DEIO
MPESLPPLVLLPPHGDAAQPHDAVLSLLGRARHWLHCPAAEPLTGPEIQALLAHQAELPPLFRLKVGEALAQGGRIAEGVAVLRSLVADQDQEADEVALVLARVYAMTGAFDLGYEALSHGADRAQCPLRRAYAAYLQVMMHERGAQISLDQAQEWSAQVLTGMTSPALALHPSSDAEVIALCVQLVLSGPDANSTQTLETCLADRLQLGQLEHIETAHALLLLGRHLEGASDRAGLLAQQARATARRLMQSHFEPSEDLAAS